MEKPKSRQSTDSFEKTEDLLTPEKGNTPKNEVNLEPSNENQLDIQMANEMIQNGKFTTFQSPETHPSQEPPKEPKAEDFKTESLKNYIDQFGNLEPTKSQKRVEISEKYDIGLKGNPQTTNSRYQNYDSNVPGSEDNEKEPVTENHEVTRFGNKSLFGNVNVRFTESTNMRIDDYKRTTNFQELIEAELLKEKMSVPEIPESVFTPKNEKQKQGNQSEEEEKEEREEKEEKEEKREEKGKGGEKEEEDEEDNRKEGIGKLDPSENVEKRHLTMIQKGRDTDFNFENNLTIMELANDLEVDDKEKSMEVETSMPGNDVFENELISERIEVKKSIEEIEEANEEETEKNHPENNVTNLVKDEQDLEKENWFKKEHQSSEEREENYEEKREDDERSKESEEPPEQTEKSRPKQASPSMST